MPAFQCPFRLQKLPTLSQRRQSSSNTLPSYRPKKRKSFTAKHFRLCYFKSFCLIFTKLYIMSYFARISAIPRRECIKMQCQTWSIRRVMAIRMRLARKSKAICKLAPTCCGRSIKTIYQYGKLFTNMVNFI